jgi:hypothetical protein
MSRVIPSDARFTWYLYTMSGRQYGHVRVGESVVKLNEPVFGTEHGRMELRRVTSRMQMGVVRSIEDDSKQQAQLTTLVRAAHARSCTLKQVCHAQCASGRKAEDDRAAPSRGWGQHFTIEREVKSVRCS